MKAKDTVMKREQLEILLGEDFRTAYSGHVAEYKNIAETQAKISFPLGKREGIREGRRQVIEQVNNLFGNQLSGYEWQGLLKEITASENPD